MPSKQMEKVDPVKGAGQEIADLCTVNKYKKQLGLGEAEFCRIDHGDGILYRVGRPSKPPLLLKVFSCESDYQRALYFLRRFRSSLPVPAVFDTVEPTSESPGAILLEWLDGNLLGPDDWNDGLAHELGSVLARLHLNGADAYGDRTRAQSLFPEARP